MSVNRFKSVGFLVSSVSLALSLPVVAQSNLSAVMPKKALVIVVPNAAAGPTDFLARVIQNRLGEALHQSVIVDNRPSANGVTAGEIVAHANPDGSTIGVGNTGTHAINATLYRHLSYDPGKDFAPIVNVFDTALVLAAHPKLKADTIKDIIALSKKAPGSVNAAIAGATGEIATNAIKMLAGIDINNVPYKGGSPAVIAVISGEAQFVLTPYGGVGPQADAGKLRILGVTGGKRDPLLPNVPTLSESGLPGYEVTMWYGLFAPAKTPTSVVAALNQEISQIVNSTEIKSKITSQGYQIVTGSPEEFALLVRKDLERYRKVILEAKMQQDL